MFDKDAKATGPGTVVGVNVKLTGILKDTNEITIHGSVDGEVVSANSVMIAETASVKGPVVAKNVVVAGKVNGSIEAIEKLEILSTGKVQGSIAAKDLTIKSGAQFNGKSKMLTEEKPAAVKKEVEKAEPVTKKETTTNDKPKYELD